MRGSMLQYFNDRGGEKHGGKPLSWPGTQDGFPVRGPTRPLKQAEYEELPLVLAYYSRAFKLWLPADKAEFDEIQGRIANGWYMEKKRVDREVAEHSEPLVWLEWLQIYGEVPNAQHPDLAPSTPANPAPAQRRPAIVYDPFYDGETRPGTGRAAGSATHPFERYGSS